MPNRVKPNKIKFSATWTRSASHFRTCSLIKTTLLLNSIVFFYLESTIPDGRRRRRPGLSQTKTNSAQAEAGARAELGKKH